MNAPMIIQLRAHTRLARVVAWLLYPAVWVGLLPVDRAVATAMRFVRVTADRG